MPPVIVVRPHEPCPLPACALPQRVTPALEGIGKFAALGACVPEAEGKNELPTPYFWPETGPFLVVPGGAGAEWPGANAHLVGSY